MRQLAATVLLGLLGSSIGCGGAARAAVISRTFDFTMTDFTPSSPTDPVTGSITVTFDDAVSVTNDSSGITLNSLNIPLDSAISYNYASGADVIEFGGVENGTLTTAIGTNDFIILIRGAAGPDPVPGNIWHYTLASTDLDYTTMTYSLTVTDVPEPASMLLLGPALLWLRRARRRTG